MLDAFLSSTAPARARLLFSTHIPETLTAVEAWAESCTPGIRVVTVTLDPVPDIRHLLAACVDAVAEVALRLWPHWYEEAALDAPTAPPVSKAWLDQAAARAAAGRRPLPRGFSRRASLRQLALACRRPRLLLVVAVQEAAPSPSRLAGLARGAEWLAREADARVVVVAPRALEGQAALEAIAYQPGVWEPAAERSTMSPEEKEGVRVWPIVGQPHPFSPGEQRLAKALAKDPELGPLFAFNQRIRTCRGSDYVVDLVWSKGRVAVEVDGYAHHSNPYAFTLDRQRDYELLISGYRVLRLPHGEVMEDVALALEKIRDVVALRRTHRAPGDDVHV